MADTSEKRFSYCVQSDINEVPTNPVFTRLAVTDNKSSIKGTPVFKEATTRKDFGAPGDPAVTGKNIAGDFAIAFSPRWSGSDDDLMRASIYADDWVPIDSVNGHQHPIDGASYDGTTEIFNFTSGSDGFPDQLTNGQLVEILGDSQLDGAYEVTRVNDNEWSLSPAPTVSKTLDAGAVMISEKASNRSIPTPIIWKDNQSDIGVSRYHLGCHVSQASYSFPIEDDVSLSLTVTGTKDNLISGGGSYTGETEVIPPAYPTIVTGDDDLKVTIDGVNQALGCAVSGLEFAFGRKLTSKKGVGVAGSCGISAGNVSIIGTINLDFQNPDYITRLYNNTPFGLIVKLPHSDDGNGAIGYSFSIPRCFLSDMSESQNESQIIQDSSFVASHDDELGFLIQICRFRR